MFILQMFIAKVIKASGATSSAFEMFVQGVSASNQIGHGYAKTTLPRCMDLLLSCSWATIARLCPMNVDINLRLLFLILLHMHVSAKSDLD